MEITERTPRSHRAISWSSPHSPRSFSPSLFLGLRHPELTIYNIHVCHSKRPSATTNVSLHTKHTHSRQGWQHISNNIIIIFSRSTRRSNTSQLGGREPLAGTLFHDIRHVVLSDGFIQIVVSSMMHEGAEHSGDIRLPIEGGFTSQLGGREPLAGTLFHDIRHVVLSDGFIQIVVSSMMHEGAEHSGDIRLPIEGGFTSQLGGREPLAGTLFHDIRHVVLSDGFIQIVVSSMMHEGAEHSGDIRLPIEGGFTSQLGGREPLAGTLFHDIRHVVLSDGFIQIVVSSMMHEGAEHSGDIRLPIEGGFTSQLGGREPLAGTLFHDIRHVVLSDGFIQIVVSSMMHEGAEHSGDIRLPIEGGFTSQLGGREPLAGTLFHDIRHVVLSDGFIQIVVSSMMHEGAEHSGDIRLPIEGGFTSQLGGREPLAGTLFHDIRHVVLSDGFIQIVVSSMMHEGAEHSGDIRLPIEGGFTSQLGGREPLAGTLFHDIRHVVLSDGFIQIVVSSMMHEGAEHSGDIRLPIEGGFTSQLGGREPLAGTLFHDIRHVVLSDGFIQIVVSSMMHEGAEHSGDIRLPIEGGFTSQLGGREPLAGTLFHDIRHVVLSDGFIQIVVSSMMQEGAEHSGDIRLPIEGGFTSQLGGREPLAGTLFHDIRHVVLSDGFIQIVVSSMMHEGAEHSGDIRLPIEGGFTSQLGGREPLAGTLFHDIRHVVLSDGVIQIVVSSMMHEGAEHSGDIRLPIEGGFTSQLGGREPLAGTLFHDIRHVVLSDGFIQIVVSSMMHEGAEHSGDIRLPIEGGFTSQLGGREPLAGTLFHDIRHVVPSDGFIQIVVSSMMQEGAEHSGDIRLPIEGGFTSQLGGREPLAGTLFHDIRHVVLSDGFIQIVVSSMMHEGAEHSGDIRLPIEGGFTSQLGGREPLAGTLFHDIRHVVLSDGFIQIVVSSMMHEGAEHSGDIRLPIEGGFTSQLGGREPLAGTLFHDIRHVVLSDGFIQIVVSSMMHEGAEHSGDIRLPIEGGFTSQLGGREPLAGTLFHDIRHVVPSDGFIQIVVSSMMHEGAEHSGDIRLPIEGGFTSQLGGREPLAGTLFHDIRHVVLSDGFIQIVVSSMMHEGAEHSGDIRLPIEGGFTSQLGGREPLAGTLFHDIRHVVLSDGFIQIVVSSMMHEGAEHSGDIRLPIEGGFTSQLGGREPLAGTLFHDIRHVVLSDGFIQIVVSSMMHEGAEHSGDIRLPIEGGFTSQLGGREPLAGTLFHDIRHVVLSDGFIQIVVSSMMHEGAEHSGDIRLPIEGGFTSQLGGREPLAGTLFHDIRHVVLSDGFIQIVVSSMMHEGAEHSGDIRLPIEGGFTSQLGGREPLAGTLFHDIRHVVLSDGFIQIVVSSMMHEGAEHSGDIRLPIEGGFTSQLGGREPLAGTLFHDIRHVVLSDGFIQIVVSSMMHEGAEHSGDIRLPIEGGFTSQLGGREPLAGTLFHDIRHVVLSDGFIQIVVSSMMHEGAEHSGDIRLPIEGGFTSQLGGREPLAGTLFHDIRHVVLSDGFIQIVVSSMMHEGAEHSGDIRLPIEGGFTSQLGGREPLAGTLFHDIRHVVLSDGFIQIVVSSMMHEGAEHSGDIRLPIEGGFTSQLGGREPLAGTLFHDIRHVVLSDGFIQIVVSSMMHEGAEHSGDIRLPIEGGFTSQLGGREPLAGTLFHDIRHVVLSDGFIQIVVSSMMHEGAEHSGDIRLPIEGGFTSQLGGREPLAGTLFHDIRHVVLSDGFIQIVVSSMMHEGAEHSGDIRLPIEGGFTSQLGGREPLAGTLFHDIRHVVLSDGFNQIVVSSMMHEGAEHSGDIRLPIEGGFTSQLGGREPLAGTLFHDIRHVVLSDGFNQIVVSSMMHEGAEHLDCRVLSQAATAPVRGASARFRHRLHCSQLCHASFAGT